MRYFNSNKRNFLISSVFIALLGAVIYIAATQTSWFSADKQEFRAVPENERSKTEAPEEQSAQNDPAVSQIPDDDNSLSESVSFQQPKGGNNSVPEEKKKTTENPVIISRYVSWGYQQSASRSIDTLVIHSSYDALGSNPYDLAGLLKEYKQYRVASHYLIDRQGNIYRLVSENNIAYHAGESKVPDGRTDVNNFSIGIELMNKESGKFTDDQYDSLNYLLRYLRSKYKIKYVLGHNQIASGRKSDPWNFEWDRVN
ncbi:MAG: N-acetylmuramoyl-L-alanine amidase [Candidatus Moranbacteria bacterium]|nr:N-acetylmuramoyl-L-alanine amidase [Candidatus Moranbacteria bacterium]